MNHITLNDKSIEVSQFFCNQNVILDDSMRTELLKLLNKLCRYEEEEKRIFPHIIIGHNIESVDMKKIFQADILHLQKDPDGKNFNRRLKSMLPFCNNGWRVYIDIQEDHINYGLLRTFTGIEGLSIDESLLSNDSESVATLKSEYDMGFVIITPFSTDEIILRGMDQSQLVISFRFGESNISGFIDVKNKFVDDFITDYNSDEVKRCIKKVFDTFEQKVHGTICLVVDKKCTLPDDVLKDGIFLEEPIDILNLTNEILNIKSKSDEPGYLTYLNERFYAITGLFVEMLNFDGITVVDNAGKIRAYNVFIKPQNTSQNINGGARKRAAMSLKSCENKNYIGVYFQSQDGQCIYERV